MSEKVHAWSCKTCGESYLTHNEAKECCPPEPVISWVCSHTCKHLFTDRIGADSCTKEDTPNEYPMHKHPLARGAE